MTDFFILNEVAPGGDVTQPSATYVFPSADSVTTYFEPWYVDESYLLLSSKGRRQLLVAEGNGLSMGPHPDHSDYSSLLKKLLIHHLSAVERARKKRKKIGYIGAIDFTAFDSDTLFRIALLF